MAYAGRRAMMWTILKKPPLALRPAGMEPHESEGGMGAEAPALQPTAGPTAQVDVATAPPTATPTPGLPKGKLTIAGHVVAVDVADTVEARRQGLSDRPSLAPDTGMVLAWDSPEVVAIWMPDMNFPLDVIFVAGGKVTAIYPDAQPCPPQGPCPAFGPKTPVDFVIEVPAGSAAAWHVAIGTAASFSR